MNMGGITLTGFILRLIFALSLVFLTFNPSGYSYFHWVKNLLPSINPYVALAGLALIIGWIIFIRATLSSLGLLGIGLMVALCGCLLWLFYYWGWLTANSSGILVWLILIFMALILALGMSWSHIHRRMSGQVDIDDIGDRN
jgi:hypothetical protein